MRTIPIVPTQVFIRHLLKLECPDYFPVTFKLLGVDLEGIDA